MTFLHFATVVGVPTALFLCSRYEMCRSNEIIVKTNLFGNRSFIKSGFIFPFEQKKIYNLEPFELKFNVKGETSNFQQNMPLKEIPTSITENTEESKIQNFNLKYDLHVLVKVKVPDPIKDEKIFKQYIDEITNLDEKLAQEIKREIDFKSIYENDIDYYGCHNMIIDSIWENIKKPYITDINRNELIDSLDNTNARDNILLTNEEKQRRQEQIIKLNKIRYNVLRVMMKLSIL